jgi:parvulin-like peptidyl-prolyl isomerase
MSDEELLERYIRGELLYVDALNQGLDRDPEVREKIDVMIKQLLEREYFQREMDQKLGIDDETVRDYYREHIELFKQPEKRKCWQILCKTSEDAEQAREAVLAGEDFSVVARRLSIDDKTREEGGKLGIFSQEDAPTDIKTRQVLMDSLFGLPSGKVSEVIATDLGYHVLKAYRAKSMPYKQIEDVAREIRETILVPDSVIESYYNEHQSTYERAERVRVRHIKASHRATANEIRQRILQGEDMATVARELSTDAVSKRSGGVVEWLERGQSIQGVGKNPDLEEAIWETEVGELGPVVKTLKGHHVFHVEEKQEAGVRPLVEVRDSIRSQLLMEAKRDAVEAAFKRLEERYKIRLIKAGERSSQKSMLQTSDGTAQTKSRDVMGEEELFTVAQDEADPTKRLDIYREIVQRFPNGERADESQFMIGFVMAEELGDTSGGRQAYEELVSRYPTSDWVDDAQAMLKILTTSQDVSISEE